jgi:hypothetical protein
MCNFHISIGVTYFDECSLGQVSVQNEVPRLTTQAMETRKLRVGQPITPEQFEQLNDEQLLRLIPRAYRDFFPGKDICTDGHFYLHDGTAWSFFKAGFLDE